ncbi:MAG: MotA/TolQ/ExbB proton channel family protein [Gammaproteobacteria bacterium]
MHKTFSNEFLFQLFSLLLSILVVHAVYVTVVWPNAKADIEQNRAMTKQDPNYTAERSWFIVLKDWEQESCFVLGFWALAIMGYKTRGLTRERRILDRQLVPIAEGMRILPEDTRDYVRQLQALPAVERGLLVPRAILHALQRFGATRNVQDASLASHTLILSEAERLEAELSMIRYILWAIPSIGFIGTVRGIGDALSVANKAVSGDISGVTESLGVAFNSTLIALLISILLMFLVHQLQLVQERLAFEAEDYLDDRLIRHLQAS